MPWDMSFNLSGTLNIFKVLARPALCLPQATISTFNDLPIPIGRSFDGKGAENGEKEGKVVIKAVVLDKDDCFAWPKENVVWPEYEIHFNNLRKAYPHSILIVSNTAGSTADPNLSLSTTLSANTGLPVLKHSVKKPGCGEEIMRWFHGREETRDLRVEEVVVVGDRLFTDVVMANQMGAWGVWVRDGVRREKGLLTRLEQRFARFVMRKGYVAPTPGNPFQD